MVDFHTHILPYMDDGSKNVEDTVKMFKEAVNAGFNKVVLTTHYMDGDYVSDAKKREKEIKIFSKIIECLKFDLKLYIGNEIFITPNIVELIDTNKASTINNSRYVLFELPFYSMPINLFDVISDIQFRNFIPILAHPERYSYLYNKPDILYKLYEQGVLMQASFGSFWGQYGKRAKLMVNKLLECNMIQFLGSDVHRSNTIYSKIPTIIDNLKSTYGKEKIDLLTNINPNLVLEDKEVKFEKAHEIKWSFKEKRIMNKTGSK